MSTPLEGRAKAEQELASGRPALVWRKVVADTVTPVGAALRLIEEGRGDFLLESVEGGEVRGRYSLLGLDPDLVFRAEHDRASINRQWQSDREQFAPCDEDTLAAMRYCHGKAGKVISVVNVAESTIARESDLSLPILAGTEIFQCGYGNDRLGGDGVDGEGDGRFLPRLELNAIDAERGIEPSRCIGID